MFSMSVRRTLRRIGFPIQKGDLVAGSKLLDVLGSIVTVALVTTVVVHPQSAAVINSMGTAFSGSIRAALGG